MAYQRGAEHHPFARLGLACQRFFERRVKFLERETGEKAEAAQVDGQNRDAARGGFARGGQERAVPSENQEQVRFGGELSASEPSRGSVVQGLGGFQVVKSVVAPGGQPFEQSRYHVGDVGAPRPGKDANGMDRSRRHCFDWAVYLNWGEIRD